MYKKLRRKFIALAMFLCSTILLVILGSINAFEYGSEVKRMDSKLNEISSNYFDFGEQNKPINQPPELEETKREQFFIVFYDNNNEPTKYIIDRIPEFSEENARFYFEDAIDGSDKGFVSSYRYLKRNNKIVFIDASQSIKTAATFLFYSLLWAAIGLLMFFILIFFGSKIIMKPVLIADKEQKMFITNASHELKTPLTIISANNELNELNNGENESTKEITTQVNNMSKLISSMLELSRINEKSNTELKQINLSNIINECIELFSPVVNSSKKTITSNVKKNVLIKSNHEIVNEIMNILFDNAIKYSEKEINVSLIKEKFVTKLIIQNDCNNIENGNLNYLFKRFERKDTNRATTTGFGIGLSIVENLASRINAKISLTGKNNLFIAEIIFK